MDSRQRIAAILKEWHQKTLAEGQAIQAGDMAALGKIQKSKTELRAPLAAAVSQWRVEKPDEARANVFRAEVHHLLALETHHSHLLTARKRKAQEKKALLEQARFNLRRVGSSYGKVPSRPLNSHS
jgi:hypothetical protein